MMARKSSAFGTAVAMADVVSGYLALVLLVAIVMSSLGDGTSSEVVAGRRLSGNRPCEEIYVVGEGETLHTISDKCGDPFIVEHKPHVHDPDNVFPGLVIMLNPSTASLQSRQML